MFLKGMLQWLYERWFLISGACWKLRLKPAGLKRGRLVFILMSEQFGLAAITDHDRVDTAALLQRLAAERQFPLLVAVEQIVLYLEYAKTHHLLTSSGSDSHGPKKQPIKYRAEQSRALLERLGIQIL